MAVLIQVILSGLVFAAVFCGSLGLLRARPAEVTGGGSGEGSGGGIAALGPVRRIGRRLAEHTAVPRLRAMVRRDMEAAGNPLGGEVDDYLAMCWPGAVLAAALFACLSLWLDGVWLGVTVPVAAVLGFAAPLWSLRQAARRRVRRIARQLPYTLDLLALTLGAGASFPEAVEAVTRDQPDDDLSRELSLMNNEIELGATRAAALTALADRIPLEPLRSAVASIIQAERLGTPLAASLKTQADVLRTARSIRAERIAASASLRLLLPSTLILIAVVIVIFAPLVMRAMTGGLW